MKYEFHVGDYVETVDGRVGYITDICKCSMCKKRGWYEPTIKYNDNRETDFISPYEVERIPKTYIRIGKYDFTKSEQPKEIKKLPDGYGDGYVLYKGMTEVDGSVDNGWVSIGALSNKINELVDAVNELRKERNNG